MSNKPNWQNRTLFRRDNLDILRAMNDESVHLIATDPPFNKGKDFHATPDSLASGASFHDRWSWKKDVHEEWRDQIQDDWPRVWHVIQIARLAHSDSMGAFLCYMAVRLIAMHRVLRADGALYLHCDQTAGHYLKMLLESIFGKDNFRDEIVWQRTHTRKGNLTKGLANDVDYILRCTKSGEFVWNNDAVTIPYDLDDLDDKTAAQYKQKDADGRLYSLTAVNAPKQDPRSKLTYEVMGVTRTWRWSRERMEKEIAAGRVVQTKPGNVPRQIRYLDEQKGKTLNNVWTDIHALHSQSKERVGYPTQKPLALYERLILASSNEGDIVLDPFAGCATTCVAAELHNRQWVGVDFWRGSEDILLQRMEDIGLCAPKGSRKRDQFNFTWQEITFTDEVPRRTDDGETAAPVLKTMEKVAEPPGSRMSRADMKAQLIRMHGGQCRGCGREFKDERYLQLDHNTPRSSGGINHISNRILLCGPCNRLKSDTLTLKGLQRENRKRGYMADQED